MEYHAVIYARCSTEEEIQKDALVKQVAEAKECVEKNGWILVDTYIESRSGTTTKNRNEYKRLYEDLLTDKFSIIVIKSQDRLMRNTKDWYLFIERLNLSKKRLYIYLENDFYTSEDALITGIKAILAEEYSRELSKKINNAHKHRQKNGGAVILTSNTYGFRKMPDKTVEIVEEEARIKRKMYELCIAGYGCRSIASILQKEGILNRNKKPFSDADILRMIRSPLNKGTVVMNRFHYDFNTKQIVKNPKEEQYIYKNKIPAIVSEQIWELANKQISERSRGEYINKNGQNCVGINQGVSVLSGKICCGLCGEPYYRRVRSQYKSKEKIYEWKCKRYLEKGRNDSNKSRPNMRKVLMESMNGCDNVHVKEKDFMDLLIQICEERYQLDKEKIVRKMLHIIRMVLNQTNANKTMEELCKKQEKIQNQLETLLEKLLEGVISDATYQSKQRELEAQLEYMESRIKCLELEHEKLNQKTERIRFIEKRIRKDNFVMFAATVQMLQEVERILVYPTYIELLFPREKVKVDYGKQFDYYGKKREERFAMLKMIQEKPEITAKEMAECLGLHLSGIQYRIRVLKREGKLYFDGKGGRGRWIVKDNNAVE